MFTTREDYTFSLENFEGPLELLLHLVRKRELEIRDIPIASIAEQYLKHLRKLMELSIDAGAEFLGVVATLMYMKSQMLLPQENFLEDCNEDMNFHFDIVQQMLDYSHIKNLAEELSCKEKLQEKIYQKGGGRVQEFLQRPMGIDHLSLEDLAEVFRESLKKSSLRKGSIVAEEEWLIEDKIAWMQRILENEKKKSLNELFSHSSCREELIVIFLALLEMMKTGFLSIFKERDSSEYFIYANKEVLRDGNRN